MNLNHLKKITELRHTLHEHPELSCMERQTKQLLIQFLKENTSLEIVDKGAWFYAVHREDRAGGTIAFRADFDAVSAPDGNPKHMCGHDGHSAALCGVALELERKITGRNVVLLFQHGEETGCGALECSSLAEECQVDEIYGLHNIPGYQKGTILIRKGTMACASKGMIISFNGIAAHAAYPEDGKNPSFAIGELLWEIRLLSDPTQYQQLVLCTVVGMKVGEKAFGVSASQGELYLTIRGALEKELNLLQKGIETKAAELAEAEGLSCNITYMDEFPATVNSSSGVERVLQAADNIGRQVHILAEPMRWSEDFGYFLKRSSGAFLGIGAGEQHPALHTAGYEYPDELLGDTVDMFMALHFKEENNG